jgi:hypothetical protein
VGEHGEYDVEVDVERDGVGEGVDAEGADGLGEALFDVHPLGVALDERLGGSIWVVGDQDGGFVVAESGDGELADGAGVGGQPRSDILVDFHFAGLAAAVTNWSATDTHAARPSTGW